MQMSYYHSRKCIHSRSRWKWHIKDSCYSLWVVWVCTEFIQWTLSLPWVTKTFQNISHYNVTTNSSRHVMRIKKNINLGIISWSNSKFFKLTCRHCMEDSKGNYYWDLGSERVKLPGCLLNVWTLRVGTYLRLSAYYIFTISAFTGS